MPGAFVRFTLTRTMEPQSESFIRHIAVERGLSEAYQLSVRRTLDSLAAWLKAQNTVLRDVGTTELAAFLSQRKTGGLNAASLRITTVHLKIRWNDFSTITRQTRLAIPCCDDITLREFGMGLLNEHLSHRSVRLIGFGVSGLTETDEPQTAQLDLFDAPDTTLHKKRNRLSRAADGIKQKFGDQSLRRGSTLKTKDPGK